MAQTTAKAGKGETPSTPTRVISLQLRETRDRRGLNAQQLADRCAEVGMPALDRSTIANIESGRRQRIGADELLVLAYVLDVSPLHLLVPRADDDAFQVVPSADVQAVQARRWIRGTHQLPGLDEKTFRVEVPDSEWKRQSDRVEEARQELLRAERALRVAKSMLETISDGYGRTEVPDAPFGAAPSNAKVRTALLLERKLSAAYERVAEATVDAEDAGENYRQIQAEYGQVD